MPEETEDHIPQEARDFKAPAEVEDVYEVESHKENPIGINAAEALWIEDAVRQTYDRRNKEGSLDDTQKADLEKLLAKMQSVIDRFNEAEQKRLGI